jgi:aldose 1-epimerase
MNAPPVQVIELADGEGLCLKLLDQGATWWSLLVPVPGEAAPREVLLGGPNPQAHLANTAYLGATVGRVANRIAGARLRRGERQWVLQANAGSRHQLHGGPDGYDRRRWQLLHADGRSARLGLHSPAGDQGFPGAMDLEVQVRLAGAGVVEQLFTARSTEATPVCLTNHAYFNLDGRDSDVRAHRLLLRAQRYAPVDEELIPLGPLAELAGTGLDFRTPRRIGTPRLAGAAGGRIDHGYLLDQACAALAQPAAELLSGDGRLQLLLATSMPALQVYTGEHLGGQPGRQGVPLMAHAGVALEPEWLPDSVHHPEWPQPDCWLQPGQTWEHRIRYTFRAAASAGAWG